VPPPTPATKPSDDGPAVGPHPDDADEVREASEAADRGEFLSPEETAAMMAELLGEA
jgi:hypothetical protein